MHPDIKTRNTHTTYKINLTTEPYYEVVIYNGIPPLTVVIAEDHIPNWLKVCVSILEISNGIFVNTIGAKIGETYWVYPLDF